MAEEDTPILLSTPTWAIACTCAVFILASLAAERTIYFVGRLSAKYNQAALQKAFEKIKEELMMVGFISIALTVGQSSFSKICVPTKWSTIMLLCYQNTKSDTIPTTQGIIQRQLLQTTEATTTCKDGHVLFMPAESIHELHILVFILATVHIVFTVVIVVLGMWVVSHWKGWEERAATKELLTVHGGVRVVGETSFVRARATNKWRTNPLLAYVAAFFQQFYNAVNETDYITLRYGFIKSHLAQNAAFNFHKYIQRSFQRDFKHVVGISPGLWVYAVVWLLVNVDGWETNIAVSIIPLFLLLAVGTKMQRIITEMADQIKGDSPVVLGMPHVKPNDNLFWFHRPRFILQCIHFILFQNALEMSFEIWAAVSFPQHNCLYGHPSSLVKRLIIGIVVQMVCGVITLPMYALISQMGSNLKATIFDEHVQLAVKKWHKRAKEKARKDEGRSRSSHGVHSTRPDALEEEPIASEMEMVVHQ